MRKDLATIHGNDFSSTSYFVEKNLYYLFNADHMVMTFDASRFLNRMLTLTHLKYWKTKQSESCSHPHCAMHASC